MTPADNVWVHIREILVVLTPIILAFMAWKQTQSAANQKRIADGQVVLVQKQEEAANRVETVRRDLESTGATHSGKIDQLQKGQEVIHELVNSRLTKALDLISDLRGMLKEKWPDDPRVKELDERSNRA